MQVVCRLLEDQATALKGIFHSRGRYPLAVPHGIQFLQNANDLCRT
jgi:hypothetical protein